MTLLSTGLLELKQQYHLHVAPLTPYRIVKRELKQQRRRRLRKKLYHVYRAYSISYNSSNLGSFCLELNSKRLYRSSEKEEESRCLLFTSFTKCQSCIVIGSDWLKAHA